MLESGLEEGWFPFKTTFIANGNFIIIIIIIIIVKS